MVNIILPSWVAHSSEKKKHTPIYSIHVHPHLPKVATAGQGNLFFNIFKMVQVGQIVK
jgi:hypothetical protein